MHRLLPILLCSCLLTTAANADDPVIASFCPSDANYTRGGAFQASLDALLSFLPAAAAASTAGFSTDDTTGASPDQAYGLAQCRADVINTSACGACLGGSARDLAAGKCAGQKKATLVYDHCLLRLSDESFAAGAGADTSSGPFMLVNTQNATEPEAAFAPRLGALMGNLSRKAAYESPRMFAAGSAAVTPFVSVYGMAQCTRDLAAGDCGSCLAGAVAWLPSCCGGKRGGQVIYPSCSIRFEEGPFYDIQTAEAAMSPAPGGGGPVVNGSNGSNHTVRTALLVSIPVAVALVVLVLVAVYLCKRNRKPHKHVQIASASRHADDEEMRSSESLLYDLSSLRAATNNFSEENKLGEGGFGPVYKGTLEELGALRQRRFRF